MYRKKHNFENINKQKQKCLFELFSSSNRFLMFLGILTKTSKVIYIIFLSLTCLVYDTKFSFLIYLELCCILLLNSFFFPLVVQAILICYLIVFHYILNVYYCLYTVIHCQSFILEHALIIDSPISKYFLSAY